MRRIWILYLSVGLVAGCFVENFEPTDPGTTPPDVQIIDVEINPNPATVGDTATFVVIIDDSLRTDLEYSWSFPGRDTRVYTE